MYFSEDDSFCPLDRFALSPQHLQDAICDLSLQFDKHSLYKQKPLSIVVQPQEALDPLCTVQQTITFSGPFAPAYDETEPASPSTTTEASRSNSIAWSDVSTTSCPSLPYISQSRAAIRHQRQRELRRQCSGSHLKEISKLVEKMVQSGDQCVVCASPIQGTPCSNFEMAENSVEMEEDQDGEESRPGTGGSVDGAPDFWRGSMRSSEDVVRRVSKKGVSKDVRIRRPRRRIAGLSS